MTDVAVFQNTSVWNLVQWATIATLDLSQSPASTSIYFLSCSVAKIQTLKASGWKLYQFPDSAFRNLKIFFSQAGQKTWRLTNGETFALIPNHSQYLQTGHSLWIESLLSGMRQWRNFSANHCHYCLLGIFVKRIL